MNSQKTFNPNEAITKAVFVYILGFTMLFLCVIANFLEYPWAVANPSATLSPTANLADYDVLAVWWDVHEGGFIMLGLVSFLAFAYAYRPLNTYRILLPLTTFLTIVWSTPDLYYDTAYWLLSFNLYYDDERTFGLTALIFLLVNLLLYFHSVKQYLRDHPMPDHHYHDQLAYDLHLSDGRAEGFPS